MYPRCVVVSLLSLFAAACTQATPSPYRTEIISVGDISESISATGEVSALIKVNVGSQVSGTVAQLRVDFNSQVKKDDILAELDGRLFKATLQKAEASVAVADADLEKDRVTLMDATRTLKRTRELFDKHMMAQADLDSAEVSLAGAVAGLKGSEARLLQARADRDAAATSLAFTKIRSPIDGVVIDRQVDVGQTVAAQFQVATLFVIANDMKRMQILANVDEADVGKVRAGMPVRFSVDAYPNETFEGAIREVRQAPTSATSSDGKTTTATNVVTYAAVVDAKNPDGKLRQGMTAQVTVLVHERKQVLRVPVAALRFRPKSREDTPKGEAGPKVYRLENEQPVALPVKVGLSDGRFSEVLEGVHANDAVVVSEVSHTPRRGML